MLYLVVYLRVFLCYDDAKAGRIPERRHGVAKKEDLRVVKTKRNIRHSFIRLLHQKSFAAITVQDILDEALINRTTFYRYYDSKYYLAKSLSEEFLRKYEELLDFSLTHRSDAARLFDRIDHMASAFYDDRMSLLALWKIRTDDIDLYGSMEDMMREKFRSFLAKSCGPEDDLEYQTMIMAGLILSSFRYLMESDEKLSVKELNQQAGSFFSRNFIQA